MLHTEVSEMPLLYYILDRIHTAPSAERRPTHTSPCPCCVAHYYLARYVSQYIVESIYYLQKKGGGGKRRDTSHISSTDHEPEETSSDNPGEGGNLLRPFGREL